MGLFSRRLPSPPPPPQKIDRRLAIGDLIIIIV